MGLFDGKVCIITGAGNGLGRAHALAFAREGAKIVVNDLGSSTDGSGASVNSADQVVSEIISLGGEAVANYDSVSSMSGGKSIIQTATDSFGRLDILINNAGILRDKTILKMEESNWDAVLAVHLKGTFSCTRAAIRVMKNQDTGGRIINTTSLAGLMGNFGQSNYASAKAGIYAFTRVSALEFQRYGITVNCIAPIAKTRLTEGIGGIADQFTPEQSTPMVLFLASDKASDITGQIFGIHGQHLFEYQMKTTPGVEKDGDDPWTVDEIADRLVDITTMPAIAPISEDSATVLAIDTLFQGMSNAFKPHKAEGWSSVLHFELDGADDWCVTVQDGTAVTTSKDIPEKTSCVIKMTADTLLGMIKGTVDPTKAFMAGDVKASNMHELINFTSSFSFRRLKELLDDEKPSPEPVEVDDSEEDETGLDPAILGRIYKGGIEEFGPDKIIAYARATNESNPRYFDDDSDKLIVPPVFPVVTLIAPMKDQILADDTLNLDIMRMVHGEHEILYHRPLRPHDRIETTVELESIDKKQSGEVLWAKISGNAEDELVYEMRAGFFFKKPRSGTRKKSTKTSDEPVKGDKIVSRQVTVDPDQSVRYAEASGDDNPIHLDKDIAQAVGLPDIILHGLCTMAFAVQSVVDGLEADPIKVKRVRTRFSKPVFMNDTLTTDGWLMEKKEGSKVIGFETTNQDGKAVLTRGEVELLE